MQGLRNEKAGGERKEKNHGTSSKYPKLYPLDKRGPLGGVIWTADQMPVLRPSKILDSGEE